MPGQRATAFNTLRFRDFRLLWFADSVSILGTQVQRMAITWQVFELTRDPFQLGLLGLFRFVPVLVFGLFGGIGTIMSAIAMVRLVPMLMRYRSDDEAPDAEASGAESESAVSRNP